jgi:hypothetical protein
MFSGVLRSGGSGTVFFVEKAFCVDVPIQIHKWIRNHHHLITSHKRRLEKSRQSLDTIFMLVVTLPSSLSRSDKDDAKMTGIKRVSKLCRPFSNRRF